MELINDPIVEAAIAKLRKRSQEGILKYGCTMARTDLDFLAWIVHAQEEAMDFFIYLERLRQDYIDMEIEVKRQGHPFVEWFKKLFRSKGE